MSEEYADGPCVWKGKEGVCNRKVGVHGGFEARMRNLNFVLRVKNDTGGYELGYFLCLWLAMEREVDPRRKNRGKKIH